jgi:hypothetical protein
MLSGVWGGVIRAWQQPEGNNPQSAHRVAMAIFWRTSIPSIRSIMRVKSAEECEGGGASPPPSLYLPSRTQL